MAEEDNSYLLSDEEWRRKGGGRSANPLAGGEWVMLSTNGDVLPAQLLIVLSIPFIA